MHPTEIKDKGERIIEPISQYRREHDYGSATKSHSSRVAKGKTTVTARDRKQLGHKSVHGALEPSGYQSE
jgi:hypothetical protein